MIGKKFTDLTTGRIVEVKDQFDDITILADNSKIRTSRLMDKSFFDEYVDPKSFFMNESLLNTFAQKIRQIPDEMLEKINDSPTPQIQNPLSADFGPIDNTPAILQADPELEKEELMRKYGIKNDPIKQAQQQMEKIQAILEETETLQNVQSQPNLQEEVIRVEVSRDEYVEAKTQLQIQPQPPVVQEDPIIQMFKNVKRNLDFKISFDLEDKIPRLDFIEMMEDSYNTSIIEFLADEFTSKLLRDPSELKGRIMEEIKSMVYAKTSLPKSNGSTTVQLPLATRPDYQESTESPVETKASSKPARRNTKKQI